MTPKEVAKKLVEEFSNLDIEYEAVQEMDSYAATFTDTTNMNIKSAKDCSLIVVDKLIGALSGGSKVFWQSVKTEIKTL